MFSRLIAALAAVALFLSLCACSGRPQTENQVPPARVLDLADWKLTLPISGPKPDWPLEVLQPELSTYRSEFFTTAADGRSVIFRAPVAGTVQPGSDFTRTELREMREQGTAQAGWSNRQGTHAMVIKERITALPKIRPSIVAGQIHDADEYAVLIRLDGTRLYAKAGGRDIGALDPNYTLGREFTVRLVAAEGRIRIFYNDSLKVDFPRPCARCYFKAGAYLQANPDSGRNRTPAQQPDPADFGEVAISTLVVDHSPPL